MERRKLNKPKAPAPGPSPNGDDRDACGRFITGNRGGPGNPFLAQVNRYRAALYDTVTLDDFKAVIRRLVGLAKAGDIAAVKVFLERVLGRAAIDIDELLTRETEEYSPDERFL